MSCNIWFCGTFLVVIVCFCRCFCVCQHRVTVIAHDASQSVQHPLRLKLHPQDGASLPDEIVNTKSRVWALKRIEDCKYSPFSSGAKWVYAIKAHFLFSFPFFLHLFIKFTAITDPSYCFLPKCCPLYCYLCLHWVFRAKKTSGY